MDQSHRIRHGRHRFGGGIGERVAFSLCGYPEWMILTGSWAVAVGAIVLALLLTKRWMTLTLLLTAVVLFNLLSHILAPAAAGMLVLGVLILFGGLSHCLHIAMKAKG